MTGKLRKELESFNFQKRKKGQINKCGRDFLYFALDFYKPGKYQTLGSLDKDLGINLGGILSFFMFQFSKINYFLIKNDLNLFINNRKINSYFSFIRAILFSRKSFDDSIKEIKNNIDNNIVSGVDISISFGGLLDHVMFVYGYDEENFYVLDTVFVERIGYEKVGKNDFLKKLPINEIKNRWTKFGRVWAIF